MEKKEKRYLIFIGALVQGGAERVISIISKRMVELGYPVEILLYHNQEIFYELHPEIPVSSVVKETGSRNPLKNLVWIRNYFKKHADVIFSFLAPWNIMAITAHLGLKNKLIAADRNDPRFVPSNPMIRKLRDAMYRFADGVVVQTTHNKAYFSPQIQRKSKIISNPVMIGTQKGIGLTCKKKKEIVSAARIMPQKNQEMLLDAFAEIHALYPEYSLTIYGDTSNQTQTQKLQEKAAQLGIGQVFHMPGNVKNILEKISDSEIFVLSSDYEGMPNALIEAMAVGLPCISTKVSGATDLIQSGINGELIDIGSTEQLVAALRKLIEDEELRKQYAEKATEITEQLTIDHIVEQWINFSSQI